MQITRIGPGQHVGERKKNAVNPRFHGRRTRSIRAFRVRIAPRRFELKLDRLRAHSSRIHADASAARGSEAGGELGAAAKCRNLSAQPRAYFSRGRGRATGFAQRNSAEPAPSTRAVRRRCLGSAASAQGLETVETEESDLM